MKTNLLIFLFSAMFSLAISSCGSSDTKKSETTNAEAAQYTCPMDTDVMSEKPGQCPKCGMDLIEKK